MMPTPFADDAMQQLRELVRAGRFSEALEWYRAVEATPAGRRGDARLLAATAATRLGEFPVAETLADEALGLYRGALLAYQRLGDRRGTAEAYHNLGLIYRQLGDWRSAEDATGEALRHAEVLGERGLLALATTG